MSKAEQVNLYVTEHLSELIKLTSVEDVLLALEDVLRDDGFEGEADLVQQAANL